MRSDSFTDFVMDQLGELPEVTSRAMFGGYGLYHRTTFFGIIHKGRLYFKTSSLTQPAYASRGMQPFRPSARHSLKQYYEVPVDILEDADQLLAWARRAVTPPSNQLPLPYTDTLHRDDLSALRDG